ncbi:hypothetical protein VTI74DRAFT_4797 [Chaetomium olivicolor]
MPWACGEKRERRDIEPAVGQGSPHGERALHMWSSQVHGQRVCLGTIGDAAFDDGALVPSLRPKTADLVGLARTGNLKDSTGKGIHVASRQGRNIQCSAKPRAGAVCAIWTTQKARLCWAGWRRPLPPSSEGTAPLPTSPILLLTVSQANVVVLRIAFEISKRKP